METKQASFLLLTGFAIHFFVDEQESQRVLIMFFNFHKRKKVLRGNNKLDKFSAIPQANAIESNQFHQNYKLMQ